MAIDPTFLEVIGTDNAAKVDLNKYKLLDADARQSKFVFMLRAKQKVVAEPDTGHKQVLKGVLEIMRGICGDNRHRPIHTSEMMPLLTITGDELYDLLTELERAGEIFQPSRGYWSLI